MTTRKRPPAPQRRLAPEIPPADWARLLPLLGCARNLGIGVSGTRGVGKSQLLRLIAWLDFAYHDVPTIVVDPVGPTTDGILGQIPYLHPADQRRLWRRIRFVNLSPTGHVVPLPLLARTGIGRETPFEVAQRFPDALARLDPKLREASIEGFNSLWEVASHGCAILFALGYQVSELPDLLRRPEAWRGLLTEAVRRDPRVAAAADYLRDEYIPLKPEQRRARTKALLTKLTLLADDVTKAQFCASAPGLDWHQLRAEKQLWLFDLRNEHTWEVRQFKLLWLFLAIIDYVKRWGAAYSGDRAQPLSLIIDEITFLFDQSGPQRSPLLRDLDGLVNRLSRNYNLHVTCSFQELFQLPSGMRQTLLSLGTQFFGRMTDYDTTRFIADRYTDYDPHLVKHRRDRLSTWRGQVYKVGEWVEEYSLAEQRELTRERLATLPKFRFLVSRTSQEGEPPAPLRPFALGPFAQCSFPPPARLAELRAALSRRDGVAVDVVMREIAGRGPAALALATEPIVPGETPPADQPPPRKGTRLPAAS